MRILGEPETPEQKEQQFVERLGPGRMILVAVAIVACVFGYIYFFTDLIHVHEEQQPETAPLLRKPLPAKAGIQQPASSAGHAAVRNQAGSPDTSPPAGPPTASAVPPAKAAAPTVSTPSPAKPASGQKGAGTAPPPVPKPKATVVKEVKPAAPVKETKVSPPARQIGASSSVTKREAAAAPSGRCQVECGPLLSDREVSRLSIPAKKAGLSVTVSPGAAKSTPMYRLFVAGYGDAASAGAAREKLLITTPAAFVLPRDGNHELFAGSFKEEARAIKEQGRLAGQGIKVTIQQVVVPVPTKLLTVTGIASREAADSFAGRLHKQGIACRVVSRN